MASAVWSKSKGLPLTKPCDEVALALLARREHSTVELRRKLNQKDYPAPEVARVLADMQARGYLNDQRYAITRARYRVLQSRWGWDKVAQELAMQGITPEAVAAAHTALEDDGVSLSEGATKLAARKLASMPTDPAQAYKHRQKAMAALLRKGYSFEEAKHALDTAREDA